MWKKIIINSVIIFIFSTLLHSFYNFLPSFLSSIISPVNESIWEHQKMIFSSYMLFLLVQYLFYKKKPNNYITSNVLSALFNIIIFLIIYIPINKLFGEIMVLTLTIYFITIVISNYIKYLIESKKNNKKLNIICGFSIIVIYIVFTILSYYPPRIELFYDKTEKMYGVYKFLN